MNMKGNKLNKFDGSKCACYGTFAADVTGPIWSVIVEVDETGFIVVIRGPVHES